MCISLPSIVDVCRGRACPFAGPNTTEKTRISVADGRLKKPPHMNAGDIVQLPLGHARNCFGRLVMVSTFK